jgi:hypothetical protein
MQPPSIRPRKRTASPRAAIIPRPINAVVLLEGSFLDSSVTEKTAKLLGL